MRKKTSFVALAFSFLLAGCFDAELALNFPEQDKAEAVMTMTASPDLVAFAESGDDAFCEGEQTENDDGTLTCIERISGTLDEVSNHPDLSGGPMIEQREDGLVHVGFDMGELKEEVTPPADEASAEMLDMMRSAFAGHTVTMSVSGAEILETNGTVSDDGKTATFSIPLEMLIESVADLPESFDTLLRPGD